MNQNLIWLLVGFLVGAIVIGFVVAYFLGQKMRDLAAEASRLEEESKRFGAELNQEKVNAAGLAARVERVAILETQLAELQRDLEDKRQAIADFQAERAELDTRLEEQQRHHETAQTTLIDQFKTLSNEVLTQSRDELLKSTKGVLDHIKQTSEQEDENRRMKVETLIRPVKEELEKLAKQTQEIEKSRVGAYEQLGEQVRGLLTAQEGLKSQTQTLVTALKNPGQRGRWGELQLRRVIEMAGMVEHCDFVTQEHLPGEGRALRPDVVVRLPNGRSIIIDSKAPYDSYSQALDTDDPAAKAELFRLHASSVKSHVQQLAKKEYQNFLEASPEFVILFLPAEPVYGAAVEQDPTLIELGINNNVLIATPMTLIAMLRAVDYGWRQERVADNAKEINRLGQELYDRLSKLGEHFARIGTNLNQAVGAYDDAVGSMERMVLPSARKLKELHAGSTKEIAELKPLSRTARTLSAPEFSAASVQGALIEDDSPVLTLTVEDGSDNSPDPKN